MLTGLMTLQIVAQAQQTLQRTQYRIQHQMLDAASEQLEVKWVFVPGDYIEIELHLSFPCTSTKRVKWPSAKSLVQDQVVPLHIQKFYSIMSESTQERGESPGMYITFVLLSSSVLLHDSMLLFVNMMTFSSLFLPVLVTPADNASTLNATPPPYSTVDTALQNEGNHLPPTSRPNRPKVQSI